MQHSDYEQKVSDEFDATWPTAGKDQSYALSFQCDVARALLAAEPDEVRDKLEQETTEQHKKALQEHNLAVQAKLSDNPEHQQQYVPNLFRISPHKIIAIIGLVTCWQQSFNHSLMVSGRIPAIKFG